MPTSSTFLGYYRYLLWFFSFNGSSIFDSKLLNFEGTFLRQYNRLFIHSNTQLHSNLAPWSEFQISASLILPIQKSEMAKKNLNWIADSHHQPHAMRWRAREKEARKALFFCSTRLLCQLSNIFRVLQSLMKHFVRNRHHFQNFLPTAEQSNRVWEAPCSSNNENGA